MELRFLGFLPRREVLRDKRRRPVGARRPHIYTFPHAGEACTRPFS